MPERAEERVLVLAPVGRDAELTSRVLASSGVESLLCRDAHEVVRELERGAGAVLLAEEALHGEALRVLLPMLADQPAWSDIPVVLIANQDSSAAAARRTIDLAEDLGHVTLLDRPVRLIALVSAVRVAIRARRRQYQARDLLARLREGVAQRDHFLAMLGHELRNPLAAITYAVAGLPAGDSDRCRDVLVRQSRHLARMVDDLLDVARFTSGKIALHRSVVDLRALAARCVESVQPSASAQGVSIAMGPERSAVQVDVDPVRIEQVITNLLVNALKYTPAGGAVRIWVAVESDGARLSVEDSGVGIPGEMLPRVFDLFMQVDGSLDRARGGLGIGLTVVRGIVELHGGTVEAFSAGRDRGTRFEVRLPLASDTAASPQAPDRAGPTAQRRRHVLVVEDDEDIRDLLRELLESKGHFVDSAQDAGAAIAKAEAASPEIALVDIGLPGKSGYELARALRTAFGERIYLAAMTGYGLPEDRAKAREAGFDVHLTKPVDLERVETLVRNAP